MLSREFYVTLDIKVYFTGCTYDKSGIVMWQQCVGRSPHGVTFISSVMEDGKIIQNLFTMIKCKTMDLLCKTLCSVKLEYFCEDKDDQIKMFCVIT
jgi:hypothetical protein